MTQSIFLGLLLIGLGVQALYVKNQTKKTGFKSFSEPYKTRLAKFPTFFVAVLLSTGILITVMAIIGVNSMPKDLQERKAAIISKSKELNDRELIISGVTEYKTLINDYTSLKNEVINYTNECNARGIKKENDGFIKNLDSKLQELNILAVGPAINSNNTSTTHTTICSICGKKFTGAGYNEVDEGIWKPCEYPYSTLICSAVCGIKSIQQLNQAVDNFRNKPGENRCKNCNLGYYKNGFCDLCGAASKERVNELRSKLPDCGLCHGTGIEKPIGVNRDGETGRICPMCNGTGKQSY